MEMKDEAKKARNEYMRIWRQNNKDKIAEINNRYWAKKAAETTYDKNLEQESM